MNDDQSIEFYRQHMVRAARSLPLSEACAFLRGALLVGEDHTALDLVRAAYVQLNAADSQLELIASGQMRLPLDGSNGKDGQ